MQVFLVAAMATDAWPHTKGVSLSRFGLLDVSLTGNVAYAGFDKASRIDFDKIGDRHEQGFNLTSFDVSITGETFQFPTKFALFLTFGQESSSIEEAFFFFHKLEAFTPLLSNFQATVGQFRVKFGQFNQIHDHEWFLADPPLIHTKFLGVDGVHLLGAELTYQPPLLYFVQFALSAQTPGSVEGYPAAAAGAPRTYAIQRGNEFVVFPRVETFFDLTDNSNLALGLSGATGQNKQNSDDKTQLIGVDFLYRWKGGTQPGWPYIRWLTEGIWAIRQNPIVQAGANKGRQVGDDVVGGFFSELGYRFTYRWQVTGRVDYEGIPKGEEDKQLRLTGALRYYLNPVAKINLQYEYSAPSGQDRFYHAFFVQLNIGIGTVTPGVGKFLDPF
jgi:hypothetical protein